MAAWVFLPLALFAAAREPTKTLTLVWHDSANLFPPLGLPQLASEVETLFRGSGFSVRFHAAAENENLQKIAGPRINAVVLPGEDRRLGAGPGTMAAARGKRGETYSIFIFYSGVLRTLGHGERGRSPRQIAELSRALARIVAHELVHALAPERGHAESGLMSKTLTRAELLKEGIDLDGPSLERARVALTHWGRSERTAEGVLPPVLLRSTVRPEVRAPCPSAK
jgi:hypothetical protein